jgi:hypothetical protein
MVLGQMAKILEEGLNLTTFNSYKKTHMKKITTLMTAMLVSICAHAQTFMGITVGGSLTSFTTQIKAKGFVTSLSETTDDVVVMKGTLNGESVKLLIGGTPTTKMTTKLVVLYAEEYSWYSLVEKYDEVVNRISSKYGTPDQTHRFFSDPYELGDGYEMTAVGVDKCFYMCVWEANDTYPNQTIAVRINSSHKVVLIYENNAMMKKSEIEQEEIDKNTY